MKTNKEVLFVCEGNVGRSQMAEGFYNHYRGEKVAISAGTDDVGWKYDYIPRKDIIEAMREKGIDISDHRIKKITKEMLNELGMIVVLCKPNSLPEFVLSSTLNTQFREVPDPFDSSMDEVRKIRDFIENIVLELLERSGQDQNSDK